MATVRLVGWREGLKAVSLIQAVRDCSTGSLAKAKRDVDELLDGKEVVLSFASDARANEFRILAEQLGAVAG